MSLLSRKQNKKFVLLKKSPFKGTFRQVFIRVYRLEIYSVMFVYSTKLCKLLPL